jgi:hypothetical protein
MDFDMTSFDPLRVGVGKFEFKHTHIRIKFKLNFEFGKLNLYYNI